VRLATVIALAVVLPLVGPAAGAATGEKTIAAYCSPSGDICYGIFNRGGHVILQITTAAHYFNRYTLCVTRLPRSPNPEHAQRCGAFPLLRRRAGTWSSSVSYTRQYPVLPPGRLQVTWRHAGRPLGPSLFFRWPARR
jgi:hypothetical protein